MSADLFKIAEKLIASSMADTHFLTLSLGLNTHLVQASVDLHTFPPTSHPLPGSFSSCLIYVLLPFLFPISSPLLSPSIFASCLRVFGLDTQHHRPKIMYIDILLWHWACKWLKLDISLGSCVVCLFQTQWSMKVWEHWLTAVFWMPWMESHPLKRGLYSWQPTTLTGNTNTHCS